DLAAVCLQPSSGYRFTVIGVANEYVSHDLAPPRDHTFTVYPRQAHSNHCPLPFATWIGGTPSIPNRKAASEAPGWCPAIRNQRRPAGRKCGLLLWRGQHCSRQRRRLRDKVSGMVLTRRQGGSVGLRLLGYKLTWMGRSPNFSPPTFVGVSHLLFANPLGGTVSSIECVSRAGGTSMYRLRIIAIAAICSVLTCIIETPALAETRLALLIGNQGYLEKVGPLKNPHNDIALV